MKFFKQMIFGTCNVIAIEDVLSFFNKYEPFKNIKKELPEHTFGSLITEIGIFFETKGFKTKLISNEKKFTTSNKYFLKSLNKYKKIGTFEDRIVKKNDIGEKPIIIAVNSLDILNKDGVPKPHYIVVLKEKHHLWLYDGKDFSQKIKCDFDLLIDASTDINRFHENGMWLLFE